MRCKKTKFNAVPGIKQKKSFRLKHNSPVFYQKFLFTIKKLFLSRFV
jgi:hypothetical protein